MPNSASSAYGPFGAAAAIPCLLGPTGAGKTAAALALADAAAISVVNADSRQVYRDFPLITAQPSPEEQARCPHLLYGFLPCGEKLSAGKYAALANEAIARIRAEKRVPLLVGGTGLYFKTLFQGIAPIPDIDPTLHDAWQARCAEEGAPALHALLALCDPDYAAKIHPNDRQRVTRALEVLDATGRTFTWWHRQPLVGQGVHVPYKVGIALSLQELEPLLARRIDLMLEHGALEEARSALERCSDPAAPGWSGIGCAEMHAYLGGQMSLDACRALWLKNTRAYAKRQLTWFRAAPDIHWFRPEQTAEIVAAISAATLLPS